MTSRKFTQARRAKLLLACCAIAAGCAQAQVPAKGDPLPEFRRDAPPGYLPAASLPHSGALLAAPTAAGSSALTVDEETARKSMPLRGTPRWNQAKEDADLTFPRAAGTYSCALNAAITQEETPKLYVLLRRTLADAANSTGEAKARYRRARPFMVNNEPVCTPAEDAALRRGGSYPSGHSAVGWTWALLLTEIAPDRTDALLARGVAYGQSRVICNVHWQSDVAAGRLIAAATVARLHAEPAFRADMDAARTELAAVRARQRGPARDCKAEAEALATSP